MANKVKVVDKGWNKIEKRLRGDSKWEVGVFGPRAQVALELEFGTEDMPEFAFIREAVEKGSEEMMEILADELNDLYRSNGSRDVSHEKVAQVLSNKIREMIEEKGLIDTGELYDSVDAKEDI